MHVDFYPSYLEILHDLEFLIRRDELLRQRTGEVPAESISLTFRPVVKAATVRKVVRADVCTLCERRISYKHGQFTAQKPAQPFVILIHNGFLGDDSRFFHDPATDKMFRNIISGTTGKEAEAFLVRELLRCHFGAEEISEKKWRDNCLDHLRADISNFGLRGILIMGEPARMLFSAEELKENLGRVFSFEDVPAVISPGPARLVHMQKNNFDAETVTAEKKRIFEAVRLFRTGVMKV